MKKTLFEISILLTLTWVAKCRASSTIAAANPFNANEDADKLLNAVRGLGTDEAAFSLLSKRTCEQRAEIRKARDDLWLKSIRDDFLLDSNSWNLIQSSMYCGPSFYRLQFKLCFDARDATGVAEMLSILSTQPDVLETVKKEYFEAEQVTFESALNTAFGCPFSIIFGGEFHKWCEKVIMTKRDVSGPVDGGAAEKEAAALIASIQNWKTDRNKLDECLLKPSCLQVREILAKFKQLNNNVDLQTAINKNQELDEHLKMAYLNMIHDLSDELDYIVTRLQEVTDKGDTLGLTRLILGRSEIDLLEAMPRYQDKCKIPLQTKIKVTVGGPANDLLIGFLGVDPNLAIQQR